MDETRKRVEDRLDQCRRALSWKPCLDPETRALLSAANANQRALRQKRKSQLGFLAIPASQKRFTVSVERLRARVVSVMEDTRHNPKALYEESQAQDLIDRLLQSDAPCIAVHGAAGTGKTTLGLQICASWLLVPKVLEKYPHGPHMIEVGASRLAANDANDAHEAQLLKQLSRLYEELKAGREPIEPTLKPPNSITGSSMMLALRDNHQDSKGGSTCATVTAQLQTLCSLICSCLSRQRCLIILDDVSREQARLIGRYILAATTPEATLIVTSRSDVSEVLLKPERFDMRPSQKLRERVLCSNAYGKGSRQRLEAVNTEAGKKILAKCESNLRLLHEIGSALCDNERDQWGSVANAVKEMPEDLEATDVKSYLGYHQRRLKGDGWQYDLDLFERAIGMFDPTDCLPEAAVYHVWHAFLSVEDGSRLGVKPKLFREGLLHNLLDAGCLERVVRVPPYNTACLLLHHTLVWHVKRQPLPELPGPPPTRLDTHSGRSLLTALCCISMFGNKVSAQRAKEALERVQPCGRDGEAWWDSFMARQLFTPSIPAALEALSETQPGVQRSLSPCANEKFLHQLLFSAASGAVSADVTAKLPTLLTDIRTAPLALAIIIGSQALPAKASWEKVHSDAVHELVASAAAEEFSVSELGSVEVLEQIWKALFFELNMPAPALPVVQELAFLRERVFGSGDSRTRAARLWEASTLAASGQQARADDVLEGARVRSLCPQIAQGYGLETQRLLALRDYKGALVCAQLSLALHRVLRGDTHPTTFSARQALAWAMHRCGLHERALDQFLEVRAQTTMTFGERHYLSLLSEAEVSVAYEGLGLHLDALQLKEQSLSELERAVGAEHPACVRLKRSTAISLAHLGQLEAAMARDRHVLSSVSSPGELLESMCDVAIDGYLAAHLQLSRRPPQLDLAFGNLRKSERMLRMASAMATQLEHSCNSMPDQLQAVKHLKLVYVLFCVRHMYLWHSQHGGCPTPESSNSHAMYVLPLCTSSSTYIAGATVPMSEKDASSRAGQGASFPAKTARSWLGQRERNQTAVTAHLESVRVMSKPERPFRPLLQAMDGPDVPEQPGENCLSTLPALVARDSQECAIQEWKTALIQCVRRQVVDSMPNHDLVASNLPRHVPAGEEQQTDVTQSFFVKPLRGDTLAVVLCAHTQTGRGALADGWRAASEMDKRSAGQGISATVIHMQNPMVTKMFDGIGELLTFWDRQQSSWKDGTPVQQKISRELQRACSLLKHIRVAGEWRSAMEHMLVDEAREIVQAASLHFCKPGGFPKDLLRVHQNQVTLEHLCQRLSLRARLLDIQISGTKGRTAWDLLDDSVQRVVRATHSKSVGVARCVRTSQDVLKALSHPQATPNDMVPLLHQLDSELLEVQLLNLSPEQHAADSQAQSRRLKLMLGESDRHVRDGDAVHTPGTAPIRVRCPVQRRGYALLGQCAPVRMHPCGHVVSSAAAESTPAKCPLCGVKVVARHTGPDVHTLRLLQVLPEVHEVPAVTRSRKALRGDASGRVFWGKYEEQAVAVKVVNVDYRSRESLFRAAQLVAITQLSSSTSRVFQKLLAVSWTARGPELVLQLCDSSLRKVMEEAGGSLPPGDVALLLVELLSAVLALHNRAGIPHGHIQPDSVLVQNERICLISCGVSVIETLYGVEHGSAGGTELPTTWRGSTADASMDVLDIAATAMFAASGLECYNWRRAVPCPRDQGACGRLPVPDFLPQPLQQLLQRMVQPQVHRRPSLQAAHRDALALFNSLATPPTWLQFVYTHSVQTPPVRERVHPADSTCTTPSSTSNGWLGSFFGPLWHRLLEGIRHLPQLFPKGSLWFVVLCTLTSLIAALVLLRNVSPREKAFADRDPVASDEVLEVQVGGPLLHSTYDAILGTPVIPGNVQPPTFVCTAGRALATLHSSGVYITIATEFAYFYLGMKLRQLRRLQLSKFDSELYSIWGTVVVQGPMKQWLVRFSQGFIVIGSVIHMLLIHCFSNELPKDGEPGSVKQPPDQFDALLLILPTPLFFPTVCFITYRFCSISCCNPMVGHWKTADRRMHMRTDSAPWDSMQGDGVPSAMGQHVRRWGDAPWDSMRMQGDGVPSSMGQRTRRWGDAPWDSMHMQGDRVPYRTLCRTLVGTSINAVAFVAVFYSLYVLASSHHERGEYYSYPLFSAISVLLLSGPLQAIPRLPDFKLRAPGDHVTLALAWNTFFRVEQHILWWMFAYMASTTAVWLVLSRVLPAGVRW